MEKLKQTKMSSSIIRRILPSCIASLAATNIAIPLKMFTPIEKLKYIVLLSFNQCSVFSFVGEAPTHIKKKEGGDRKAEE